MKNRSYKSRIEDYGLKEKVLFFLMVTGMVFFIPPVAASTSSLDGQVPLYVVTSAKATATLPVVIATKTTDTFAWVDEGWKWYKNNHIKQAMQAWKKGLNALPSNKVLLFSGIFSRRKGALGRLDELGQDHHVFLLKHPFKGHPAFYVLLAGENGSLSGERAYLMQKLNIPYPTGRSAEFFQQTSAGLHAQKRAKTPIREAGQSGQINSVAEAVSGRDAGLPEQQDVHHAAQDSMDTPELFDAFHAAQASGDQDKVLSLAAKLLARNAASSDMRIMYARLQVLAGQYEAALTVLSPLLVDADVAKRDWRPWFWAGTIQLMLGQLDQASAWLDKSLSIDGNHAAVWVQRALVEQQRKHHSVALRILYMAEALHPNMPAVELNIGLSNEAVGRVDRALHAYQLFLKASSGHAEYIKLRLSIIRHIARLK